MPAKQSVVRPRWSKVLADLWDNKTRTLLVVLSIAVGVFAIGTIANAFTILAEDMGASYASVNPANITIITEPFDDNFLNSVRDMPGVQDAEGRHHFNVGVILGGQPAKSLELIAIKDYAESQINLLEPKEGRPIPGEGEVLIGFDYYERSGLPSGRCAYAGAVKWHPSRCAGGGLCGGPGRGHGSDPDDDRAMSATIRWNGWAKALGTIGLLLPSAAIPTTRRISKRSRRPSRPRLKRAVAT